MMLAVFVMYPTCAYALQVSLLINSIYSYSNFVSPVYQAFPLSTLELGAQPV